MTRAALVGLVLGLSACVPVTTGPDETAVATRAAAAPDLAATLPPIKTFGTGRLPPPRISNADLVRDFLDLSFALESGRDLTTFTRFETPITVRVTGAPPPTLGPDLTKLMARLQTEAGIDIRRTQRADANITIEAVPRADIRRALPQAACFVVPGIDTISAYRSARRSARTSWTDLRERTRLGIFVPSDASPQEVRDCLHEELAQALGPLNDLYRLSGSVFNDDNVHTVLTPYDMLILRATYDPALRSGMGRDEVAARLPAIFARIHPAGERRAARPVSPTPKAFRDAIETALGPGSNRAERRAAADRALSIAAAQNWRDHRHAFALYAAGRLTQASDPDKARAYFRSALAYYTSVEESGLHQAYVATQLGAHALADGDAEAAHALVTPAISIAATYENAALMATLMLIRSEALDLMGAVEDARTVRLDSLGWARYGFGPDWAVRAKVGEIAALNPSKGRG